MKTPWTHFSTGPCCAAWLHASESFSKIINGNCSTLSQELAKMTSTFLKVSIVVGFSFVLHSWAACPGAASIGNKSTYTPYTQGNNWNSVWDSLNMESKTYARNCRDAGGISMPSSSWNGDCTSSGHYGTECTGVTGGLPCMRNNCPKVINYTCNCPSGTPMPSPTSIPMTAPNTMTDPMPSSTSMPMTY